MVIHSIKRGVDNYGTTYSKRFNGPRSYCIPVVGAQVTYALTQRRLHTNLLHFMLTSKLFSFCYQIIAFVSLFQYVLLHRVYTLYHLTFYSNLFFVQPVSSKNNVEGIFNRMHVLARYGARNDYNQLLFARTTFIGASVLPSREITSSYFSTH